MSRFVVVTTLVALLVGVLVGFLWWGMPVRWLQSELGEARTRAERVDELQAEAQQLEAQLKAAEADLGREREMNARLQAIVSQGKK
jgi:hypothetical protein